jgi:hypothetical protein
MLEAPKLEQISVGCWIVYLHAIKSFTTKENIWISSGNDATGLDSQAHILSSNWILIVCY